MRSSCLFLLAMSVIVATGTSAIAVNLDPGGNVAISRLDPNDPSLTGDTQAVLNSDFTTYAIPGIPLPDPRGSMLSQAVRRSDDGGLDFSYQFTSTGSFPIVWQGCTIGGFAGLDVDVLYLAQASDLHFIVATRSADGSSIGIITGSVIDIPLVFRTNASGYDSGVSANLQFRDNLSGGEGRPPTPFWATASVIAAPEPSTLVILGLAYVLLAAFAGQIAPFPKPPSPTPQCGVSPGMPPQE